MSWNADEMNLANAVVADIQGHSVPRTTSLSQRSLTLSASEAVGLQNDLRCQTPGLVVRLLLRLLGFDESRLFRWRLEHKLVQALVLHHYCPNSVPATRGFAREFQFVPLADRRERVNALTADGNLVKPVLGYGSGERNAADHAEMALVKLDTSMDLSGGLISEEFIIQKKVDIIREYRVNTMEDRVIPGLTFHRYDFGEVLPEEREAVDTYVKKVLDQLPNAMVHGSLFAWDVARARDGRFMVIEINLAGFHPVFERGFQCTGLFSDPICAAAMTGRLLSFVERCFQVQINVPPQDHHSSEEARTFVHAGRWKQLINIAADILALKTDCQERGPLEGRESSAYFGEGMFHFLLSQLFENARSLNDLSLISGTRLPREDEALLSDNLSGALNPGRGLVPKTSDEDPVATLPRSSDAEFAGPRTPTECVVAAIWSELLDVNNIGIYDDFLQLGGNSVTAVRGVSRIRKEFGLELPLSLFFESYWTVAGMSAAIDDFNGRSSGERTDPVAPDQRAGGTSQE
jgi:acyl carrier protein